jgi:para-aminobenzoate synthetase
LHTAAHRGFVNPGQVFSELYAASVRAFWLTEESRFSYLGDDTGPLSEFCHYNEGVVTLERAGHPLTRLHEDVSQFLRRRLAQRSCAQPDLPFDFTCGWVGSPDAAWLFADRVVVVDRAEDVTYLLCLAQDTPYAHSEATAWLDVTLAFLSTLPLHDAQPAPAPPGERWLLSDRAKVDMLSRKEELHAGER